MTDLDRVRKDDPFLRQYQSSDLRIASEFLTTWLPFLSGGLCRRCTRVLSTRIRSLEPELDADVEPSNSDRSVTDADQRDSDSRENCCDDNCDNSAESLKVWVGAGDDTNSLGSWKDGGNSWSEPVSEPSTSGILGPPPTQTPSNRISWADMAEEDEFEEEEEEEEEEEQKESIRQVVDLCDSTGDMKISKVEKPKLSREQRESLRFTNVQRKKDFICLERVKGKIVNILEGLELHTCVFSAAEQNRIVNYVYELEEKGKRGELKERTYTAPQKWMRGKGRLTIQFGCCYNYAVDKHGNPPGILQSETVDPIPPLFKVIIRRLVRWHVLPASCVPDSCIVNIYEEGDCIPPHIDNHDFVRPFCTVSFLCECNIVFGSNLKILGPGEFAGSIAIPLPVGSVLVLNGNSADVSKHCVPSVPMKRMSITFRRMDEGKRPTGFVPEPDLQGLEPLVFDVDKQKKLNSPKSEHHKRRPTNAVESKMEARRFGENGSQSEPRYPARSRQWSASKRRVK